MGFVSDGFVDRRRLRRLNIMNDVSNECLAIEIDRQFHLRRVIDVQELLSAMLGLLKRVTVDHGMNLISNTLDASIKEQGLKLRIIEPGRLQQKFV
jgi:hypothetical protein